MSIKFNHEALWLLGINCHQAPISLIEQYFCDSEGLQEKAKAMAAMGLHGFIIATCDRVEIILQEDDLQAAHQFAYQLLGVTAHDQPYFYHYQSIEALTHLLRTASALDSRMIGETQILGQLKAQFTIFADEGCIDKDLQAMLQFILQESAIIRHETGLGSGIVSVGNHAVAKFKDLFGDDANIQGLIIGLSEAGETIATRIESHLNCRKHNPFHLTTPSRRGKKIAGLRARPFWDYDDLAAKLANYDVIITAHGAGEYLLDKALLAMILKKRKQKFMLIFDHSDPPDMNPDIQQLDEIYYYNIDALRQDSNHALQMRAALAKKAETMVEASIYKQITQLDSQLYLDDLAHMQAYFESARMAILNNRKGLDADHATKLLLNRLLHLPFSRLKQIAMTGDQEKLTQYSTMLRDLFK